MSGQGGNGGLAGRNSLISATIPFLLILITRTMMKKKSSSTCPVQIQSVSDIYNN